MQTWLPIVIGVVIVGLVVWIRTRRSKRPIRGNGIGILVPVIILFALMGSSLYQLMHIPGKVFHMPAFWELVCAGLLGAVFGVIMLTQTAYMRKEDGLIYSKPNKSFKFVIIGIVLIRLALTQYFKGMDYTEFTVLTMTLAVTYLGIWRIGSFVKFRQIARSRTGPEV